MTIRTECVPNLLFGNIIVIFDLNRPLSCTHVTTKSVCVLECYYTQIGIILYLKKCCSFIIDKEKHTQLVTQCCQCLSHNLFVITKILNNNTRTEFNLCYNQGWQMSVFDRTVQFSLWLSGQENLGKPFVRLLGF